MTDFITIAKEWGIFAALLVIVLLVSYRLVVYVLAEAAKRETEMRDSFVKREGVFIEFQAKALETQAAQTVAITKLTDLIIAKLGDMEKQIDIDNRRPIGPRIARSQ